MSPQKQWMPSVCSNHSCARSIEKLEACKFEFRKLTFPAILSEIGQATHFLSFNWAFMVFFPTCQVRVVRFYQSALPPRPRPPPRHPPPPPRLAVLFLLVLLLQFLLNHVCINFHLHFRLANSSPSSLPTLFADSLRQALCQLPSSVCTAGPQPGTFPAQCAPLDLNLGPAQLSVHRWTSTAR